MDQIAELSRIFQQKISRVLAEWFAREQSPSDCRSRWQTCFASITDVRRKGHCCDRTRHGWARLDGIKLRIAYPREMANRYGEAALQAVRMNLYGKALTPVERWQDAVQKLYPTQAGQKKKAPREAFVGLCDAGLVKGITVDNNSVGNRNKDYAVAAVELLRAGTHKTVTQLWSAVTDSDGTEHACQMDVVLALWKNNLIN